MSWIRELIKSGRRLASVGRRGESTVNWTREQFLMDALGSVPTHEQAKQRCEFFGLDPSSCHVSDKAKEAGVTEYDLALVGRRMSGIPWEPAD